MNFLNLVVLCLVSIFIPPLGVLLVTGCNADVLVNIVLTFLGFIPGHFHAFYILFVYYYRSEQRRKGIALSHEAPLVFSDKVNNGGHGRPHYVSDQYQPHPQYQPQPTPQPQQPVYGQQYGGGQGYEYRGNHSNRH